ncbi:gpK [Escherichia phage St-1]|uniref:GpK n=1 Tax=Escherichia phage St-1 TaxID=10845 RepID=C6K2G2_BPST1|nr:gpK [Escherichia phage St-1]ACS44789.1 gpK [Escherichia phage St-1]
MGIFLMKHVNTLLMQELRLLICELKRLRLSAVSDPDFSQEKIHAELDSLLRKLSRHFD